MRVVPHRRRNLHRVQLADVRHVRHVAKGSCEAMATESQTKYRVTYVQFTHVISVGGHHTAFDAWSAQRHETIACEVAGNWVVLTLPSGERRKVPMTRVVYITECEVKS